MNLFKLTLILSLLFSIALTGCSNRTVNKPNKIIGSDIEKVSNKSSSGEQKVQRAYEAQVKAHQEIEKMTEEDRLATVSDSMAISWLSKNQGYWSKNLDKIIGNRAVITPIKFYEDSEVFSIYPTDDINRYNHTFANLDYNEVEKLGGALAVRVDDKLVGFIVKDYFLS